jgi:hypothetical protein
MPGPFLWLDDSPAEIIFSASRDVTPPLACVVLKNVTLLDLRAQLRDWASPPIASGFYRHLMAA